MHQEEEEAGRLRTRTEGNKSLRQAKKIFMRIRKKFGLAGIEAVREMEASKNQLLRINGIGPGAPPGYPEV